MKFLFERQLPAGSKILVCFPPALGDFVLCLPALAALRQAHAGAHVEALAQRDHCKLLDRFKLADGSTIAHPGINQPQNPKTAAAIDDYFARFDACYSLLGHGFRPHDNRLKRVFPAKPDRSYSAWVLHGLGLDGADATPRIPYTAPRAEPAAIVLHADITPLHLPAWLTTKWLRLAKALAAQYRLIIVGGPREAFAQQLAEAGKGELLQNLSLDALAEKLATATAFVCADSGIGHLCSALGLKGISMHAKEASHLAVWRAHGATAIVRPEDKPEAALAAVQTVFKP